MSTRTFLTQEIRPYKIDVYGLQDNYIGTLQSYNDNFIGQTTEPLIVVSKDGTQSFTCSIPKYYIDPITNEKIINPRWEDTKNGVLAENTRILKAFVNFKDETKVFPFIVDEIKDKRDSHFSTFKEIKANGLAFAELGKIGYKIELNQTLFESNELEENPEAIMTIQYWLDQVFPSEKDENGNIIKWLTPWCYEIRMDWSQYPTESRLATKVYDDRFINSWAIDDNTNELIANGIQASREKSRAIDCKNSNKYNITQDIAKAFEVFCDYEYKTAANGQFIKEYTDENGLVWTGRKVIFYNSAININNPLYLNYQKNLQTIERTAESSELYTKLFVTPSESSIMKNGYVTIADTFANPTLDDFILNFDYLYSVGSISDYQMQFAKNYEVEVRRINSHLMAKSPVIDDLVVEINDREAEIAGYNKQIASARDQYTYYEKLKNSRVTNNLVVKNKTNSYHTIFVPEGTVYRAALKLEGIIASSIRGYINKYSEPLFENADLKLIKSVDEIDDSKNYFLLLDEYDFPSAIYSIITPSDVVLYLDLEYSPRNKYENICTSFLNEIDNYEKQKITIEEIVVGLESQLEKVQKEYNDKLKEKEELNQKLERIMGPALREGYWTPDRYDDVGQAHIKECSFNNGIEFTTSLFENEQLSYVDIGKDRIYYPYINIDNQLKNKWTGHDLNNLILHLQRDFAFTATEQATLDVGNYYFLYNSRQYYFKLDNKLAAGDSLTIKIEGATINLILNNSSPIELVSFLEDATNVTQRFEDSTVTLGDYLLYNNAGFIFSFKHNENNELTPILLLNNDKLFSEYRKYNRLAYSFQGETVVTLIEGIIQDYPNIAYSIYFPRILLAEDNVIYTSDTLTITIGKDENAIELKKYYDYSVLLHEGKTCITLKLTGNNPFYNLVDASIIYNVNYRVSQANEALYIDAKQVAKDNSKPKFSYDVSVALISSWEDNQIEKMPLIELGQLAYISDPILGVHAVTGYVSEITYKLDKPQEDEIKIQNYKTKFEDLFETITASSEAMKNNQVAYDIAAGNFGPNGAISGDVIQTAINNNDFFFNYSTTGVDINPTEGIVLTNRKPYANGVYGQVVLQGGGIFLSDSVTNTGERIWNNGITPKGINASLITSGQINTSVIKVFSGDDMTFQWNSEGIYSYKLGENGRPQPDIYVKYSQQGLHLTNDTLENWNDVDKVNDHQSLVSLDWDGLTLRNNSGQKTLSADLDGNLTIRGTLKSYDYREGESRLLSTGWKIEPTGYAEFNDLFVRGTISASVFEYEETSAVGGRLLVSPTFILKSEHTNKASIEMTADAPLKIIVPIGVSIENNSFVAGGRTWKLNDVVIFNGKFINKNAFPLIKLGKNINGYPIYETKQLHMIISNLNPTNNTITLTSIAMVDGLTQNLFYDANGNIADTNTAITAMGGLENIAGTGDWHLISFGTDGAKEGILLTAIEPDSGSYIDILGKGKDNLTDSTRVRLGDLSGLAANQELIDALGATPQGWGLYADNAYLRGAIYATSGKIGSLSIDQIEKNVSNIAFELNSSTNFTYAPSLSGAVQLNLALYVGNIKTEEFPSGVNSNLVSYIYQYSDKTTSWTNLMKDPRVWSNNRTLLLTEDPKVGRKYRAVITITDSEGNKEVYETDAVEFAIVKDGQKGQTGNGIDRIEEWYAVSDSDVSAPSFPNNAIWKNSIEDIELTSTNKYLWAFEIIYYTNDDNKYTEARIISTYVKDGRGVSRIENWYLLTGADIYSITEEDIGKYTWSNIPLKTSNDKPYLWNYEKIIYTTNEYTIIAPRLIGTHGDTGNPGRGVASITEEYAISDSKNSAPTDEADWSTKIITPTKEKPYLWCRETIGYDSTEDVDNSVFTRIISTYSKDGKGIDKIENWYLASSKSSGITSSTSGWSKDPAQHQTSVDKKYLWNYEVIYYTTFDSNGTQEKEELAPRIIGTHGERGQDGDPGKNAVQYSLVPNVTSIVRDLGNSISPLKLTFSVNKIDGETTTTVSDISNFILTGKYITDNSTEIIPNNLFKQENNLFTLSVADYTESSYKALSFTLNNSANTQIYHTISIPFELGDKLRELGTIKDGETVIADGKVTTESIVAGAITAAQIATGAITAGALTNIGELYLMSTNGTVTYPSINDSEYWTNGVFNAKKYDDAITNINKENFNDEGTSGIKLSSEGIFIKSGSKLEVDTTNFKINSDGDVTVTGTINATSGRIGSLTIGQVENELDSVHVKIAAPGGPFIKGDNLVAVSLQGSFYTKAGIQLTKTDLESKFTNISIKYQKSTLTNGSWGNWVDALGQWYTINWFILPRTILNSYTKYRICLTYTKGEYNNIVYSDELVFAIAGTYITQVNKPEYAKSTNGTVPPADGWSSTIPTTIAGEFLWTKIVTEYSDGTESVSYSVAAHGATGATGERAVQYTIIPSVTAISRDLITPISPVTLTYSILQSNGTTQIPITNLTGFTFKISNITSNTTTTIVNSTTNLSYDLTNYAQGKTYGNVDSIKLELYYSSQLVSTVSIPITLGDDLRELGKVVNNQVIINDGKVYADAIVSNAIATRHIEAGAITANKIAADTITSIIQTETSGNIALSENGMTLTGGSIHIDGGAFTVKSGKFKIDDEGNVTLEGEITAKTGLISGWAIGETSLYSGSGESYIALSSDSSANFRIWAGKEKADDAPFRVEKDGTVTLTKIRVLETNPENTTTGEEKIISLYDQPFWAIWPAYNGAIKNLSIGENNTLIIETYGGKKVNFNKAAVNSSDYFIQYGGSMSNISATLMRKAETPESTGIVSYANLVLNKPEDQPSLAKVDLVPTTAASGAVASLSVGELYTEGVNSVGVAGYWNGSGTYNISTTTSEIKKMSTTISLSAEGAGADNFSVFVLGGGNEQIRKNVKGTLNRAAKNVTLSFDGHSYGIVQVASVYEDGREKEAETLAISSSSTSISPLGYGESVIITATTAKNTTGKSITITAPDMPEDNYGKGYDDGSPKSINVKALSYESNDKQYSILTEIKNKLDVTTELPLTISAITAYNAGADTLALAASSSPIGDSSGTKILGYDDVIYINASTDTKTKYYTITSPSDRYGLGETDGILLVRNNSTLGIEGEGVAASVVAKYSGSEYNRISLKDFYMEGITNGATDAINKASLALKVDDNGKTATGTISTLGVDTIKTISGIDVSDAYKIGADSVTISGSWDGMGTYTAKTSTGKPVSTTIGIWGIRGTSDSFTVSAGVSGSGDAQKTANGTLSISSNTATGIASVVIGGVTVAQTSVGDVFKAGVTDGANSLVISPTEDDTLEYEESVTITATTTDGTGNPVTKTVKITAPADNYNTGWNDAKGKTWITHNLNVTRTDVNEVHLFGTITAYVNDEQADWEYVDKYYTI